MSSRDLERDESRALVRLVESIRKLKPQPQSRLLTRTQAARHLGVSLKELKLRIATGELDTVNVGRRELIFL